MICNYSIARFQNSLNSTTFMFSDIYVVCEHALLAHDMSQLGLSGHVALWPSPVVGCWAP